MTRASSAMCSSRRPSSSERGALRQHPGACVNQCIVSSCYDRACYGVVLSVRMLGKHVSSSRGPQRLLDSEAGAWHCARTCHGGGMQPSLSWGLPAARLRSRSAHTSARSSVALICHAEAGSIGCGLPARPAASALWPSAEASGSRAGCESGCATVRSRCKCRHLVRGARQRGG